MSTISPQARQELVTAVAERYQRSTPAERGRILDEFVALTGYHRKHSIRVLNGSSAVPAVRRGRRSVYDEAVTEGLVVLWEASDRVCGKRLKALLPTLVPALERHGHVTLDPRVREQLMAVSAATIDRRLASARAVTAGQRRRRRSGGDSVRGRVPVRTFGDWQDPAPGFVEADLVAHCGSSMAGSFVWTLVLTDIASGWTECVPLLVRAAGVVVDAVDRLRGALPFPLRGIDTDNGSEFLNEVLIGFCKEHGIELTRSRPYRKNDQAWVEQKNGAVVRRLVGYGRLEGMPGAGSAGAPVLGGAPVRERVPAVVQARREDTGRRPRPQALPRAGDAVCAVTRLGHGSRRDEGPSAGAGRNTGSARVAGRDPCGSTSSGRTGCGLDGSSDAATRCRPRRLSAELGAGLARWRGAADAPASQETAATLAYSAGSVRDDVAPCRRVAGGGTASDGEGALRPSAAGAPGDVPPGPTPDSAAPRQGLASSRRPSSRVCRSDRSVPRRCCVTEPRRRFERLGFRLSAIDPDPGGRDRVAAGRPACQRAARVLRCATALRVTRRPSRGSDGSYGPCGPAWTGRPWPSTTPHGTRQTAGFRMARRTGTGWSRRQTAATSRRAWLRVERMVSRARGLREGDGGPPGAGGRPCCSPQTHTNADLRARSTPRAAACSAPE